MLMNINQMAICLTAGRSDGSALMVIGVSTWYPDSHSQLEPCPPHVEWQHPMTSAGIPYFPARWYVNNTSFSATCFIRYKSNLEIQTRYIDGKRYVWVSGICDSPCWFRTLKAQIPQKSQATDTCSWTFYDEWHAGYCLSFNCQCMLFKLEYKRKFSLYLSCWYWKLFL